MVAHAGAPDRTWSAIWGSKAEEGVNGIALEGGGSTYVVGYTFGAFDGESNAGDKDAFLSKYDASGNRLWTQIFGTSSADEAHDVSLSPGGHIYVVGDTWGAFKGSVNQGASDIFVAKLSPNGRIVWLRQYGSSSFDEARGVHAPGDELIYVAGLAASPIDGEPHTGGRDLLLSRFRSNGIRLWTRMWGSTTHDYGNAVAADSSGNAYVTGFTYGSIDKQPFAGSTDIFLTKYSVSGTKQWTAMWGAKGQDQGRGISVGAADAVYVTGQGGGFHGQQGLGSTDVFLTKFSAADTWLWTRIFGSTSADEGFDVHAGPDGLVYVTGHAPTADFDGVPGTDGGVFLTAHTPAGVREWTVRWGASDTDGQGVRSLHDGALFVGASGVGGFDGIPPVGDADACLTRLDPRTMPDVNAFYVGGGMEGLEFQAEAEGEMDRVEFYMDGTFVGTAYSAPYVINWHPALSGMSWAELAGDHMMSARAFDVDDKEHTLQSTWRWNDNCTDIVPDIRITFPWNQHMIYAYTGTTPSEEVLLTAEASVLDLYWNPATAIFQEQDLPVDRVRFYVDSVFAGETNQPSAGTDFTFQVPFNTGGMGLGYHSVLAYAYTDSGCIAGDTSTILVEGPPNLDATREVLVCENQYTVTVTVENTGEGDARFVTVRDSALGLQIASVSDNEDLSGYAYDPLTRRSYIEFYDPRIETNESVSFTYHAIPILFDGVEEYEIGGDSKIFYTDLGGNEVERTIFATPDDAELCGHPVMQSVSSQARACVRRADYLLVTNPQNLLGLYDTGDVGLTLAKMAELAVYRNGVLGYYGTRLPLSTHYRAGDLITTGNIIDGRYREVMVWDDSDHLLRVYNRFGHKEIAVDPPTDPATFLLPFELDLRDGDKLAAGDVLPERGDASRHGHEEIVVAWSSAHGSDAGWVTAYSWNYVADSRSFSSYHEDLSFGDDDELLVGDVLRGGSFDEDKHEIIRIAPDGTMTLHEGLTIAPAESVVTVYQVGDGTAIGNLLDDEAEEVLILDRSAHFFSIYQWDAIAGSMVERYSGWLGDGWNEDETVAVGNVTGDEKAEILFADPEEQEISVLAYDPSAGFTRVKTFEQFFHASDPLVLLAANVMGSGEAEILVPRGSTARDYVPGEISAISYSDAESPGDRHALDELLNEGGDWAVALDQTDASPDELWSAGGHLLLVGEENIIPAFSAYWDLAASDHGQVDHTDKDYANTTGDFYPELAMGRIIGDNAYRLATALQHAIDVACGAVPFEVGAAYAVNGSDRGSSGEGDSIDFDEHRDDVAATLTGEGFTVLERNDPAVATFMSDARNKDMIFMFAHGWYGGWENVTRDDVATSFDPGTRRPFMYANSCSTARYAGHYSLAEAFLRYGASGYIGATATSVSPWSWRLSGNFASNLDPTRTLGESWRSAVHHRLGVNTWAWDPEYNQYNCFIHQLFGDPKQMLEWPATTSGRPASMDIQGPLSTFHVDLPAFKRVTDKEGNDTVTLERQPQLIVPFKPQVPTYVVRVVFPRGFRIQNVSLTERGGLNTDTGYKIPAVEPAVEKDPVDWGTTPSTEGTFWPNHDFAWEVIDGPGNSTILAVTIYPFFYDADTSDIRFYRDYDFTVDHTESSVEIVEWRSDQAVYEVGDTIDLHAWLWQQDTKTAPDVTAKVFIRDAGRSKIDTLPTRLLENLRGGHATCGFAWVSTGTPAGHYEAVLYIVDLSGDILATSTLFFRLGRPGGRITAIELSPGAYRVGDVVEIGATFDNHGSLPLDGSINLVIRDAAGSDVEMFSGVFSNLVPSASTSLSWPWTSTLAPRNCEIVAYASFMGETTPLWISRPWSEGPLLIDIDRSTDGRARVRWPSVADRTYVIEACTNLETQTFSPLAPAPLTAPPENLYTDPEGRIHRAYRVWERVP